jgi:dimeric dUTPase (all-alpha-NTP-PPase superfamily)
LKLNPENKCADLMPQLDEPLPDEDALKTIYEMQKSLQERLGQLEKYRAANMQQKTEYVKDNIIHIMVELSELLERLPFKHWKTYSTLMKETWVDDEQRAETLFEFIDVLHFFMNIPIILGFSPEEIFHCYLAKNKENFRRQDNNY